MSDEEMDKYSRIFWSVTIPLIALLLIFSIFIWKPSPEQQREQQISSIIDACLKKNDGSGVFYDNGFNNLPLCRQPENDNEKKCDDLCTQQFEEFENNPPDPSDGQEPEDINI